MRRNSAKEDAINHGKTQTARRVVEARSKDLGRGMRRDGQFHSGRLTLLTSGDVGAWSSLRIVCHSDGRGSSFAVQLCPTALQPQRDRVQQRDCSDEPDQPFLGIKVDGRSPCTDHGNNDVFARGHR